MGDYASDDHPGPTAAMYEIRDAHHVDLRYRELLVVNVGCQGRVGYCTKIIGYQHAGGYNTEGNPLALVDPRMLVANPSSRGRAQR